MNSDSLMSIIDLDHVQLAMPEGGEDKARRFYGDVLGLYETPKPAALAARGGVWFHLGAVKVHLGVERDYIPARKAHPAFVVADLSDMISRLEAAGFVVVEDDALPAARRIYVNDPFGNRIEIMQKLNPES